MKENLQKLTREEVKARQLYVLQEMDRFCKEHNIKYMLAYGTLIGAIRHKGFIPWDDDIDVMMTRPEFERFIELYKENKDFGIANVDTQQDYYFAFSRLYDKKTVSYIYRDKEILYGVNIDIYPMDGAPDTISEYNQQLKDLRNEIYRHRRILKAIKFSYFYIPGHPLVSFIRKFQKKSVRRMEQISLRYDYHTSKNISCIASAGLHIYPKEWLDSVIEVPFEHYSFNAPKEYDSFLREEYGDYMQLPPEENRIPYHGGSYYWK